MPKTVKKVCVVSISLAKGGAERSVAVLTQMLAEKGHEVHLIILNDEIDYPFSGTLFNLGKYKTGKDTFIKRLLRLRKLRRYLIKNKFDFIIDHIPKHIYTREMFYLKYVYKNFRKIYVIHSSKLEHYLDTNKKLRQIFSQNFATVAVSKYIEQEVLLKRGITNALTIYNTVEISDIEDVVMDELHDKKYILWYGRIEEEVKNLSFLIDSFSLSKLWEENIYLVIMGEGNDKENLQKRAQKQTGKDYILFLPHTKKPFPYVTNSKYVVLTSYYEGFPMVLVESLSLGVPVVSLDIISGPNEIIKNKENGILVKDRDSKKFAQAMRLFFEDENLYAACKKNAKSSVSAFSKVKIAEQWHQLLNS